MTPRLVLRMPEESLSLMSRNRRVGLRVAKPGNSLLMSISKLLAMGVRALLTKAIIRSMSILRRKECKPRTRLL